MKKILVTGSKGKLGSLLVQRPNFFALDCDITDLNSIEESAYGILGEEFEFDLVVNCAGVSSVDECEKDYEKAIKVNVKGLSNLHKAFGSRVLNISSDHIWSGKSWWLPNENTKLSPINAYGFTKVGAESVSKVYGGKIIRLSRTVSADDKDIREYFSNLSSGEVISVPSFFHRNYIHKEFAVDGIEYFAKNYDAMPDIVNYAGLENFSMYLFIMALATSFNPPYRPDLIFPRDTYEYHTARPKRGGFKVDLAKKLGFPMYSVGDTVSKLIKEANA